MKTLSLFLISAVLCAAQVATQPTDTEKLKLREAQQASLAATIHMYELQAQAIYRKGLADLEAANKAESDTAVALGKKYGCEIDPVTVSCKLPQKQ